MRRRRRLEAAATSAPAKPARTKDDGSGTAERVVDRLDPSVESNGAFPLTGKGRVEHGPLAADELVAPNGSLGVSEPARARPGDAEFSTSGLPLASDGAMTMVR